MFSPLRILVTMKRGWVPFLIFKESFTVKLGFGWEGGLVRNHFGTLTLIVLMGSG